MLLQLSENMAESESSKLRFETQAEIQKSDQNSKLGSEYENLNETGTFFI
jgi:hypothetical protein